MNIKNFASGLIGITILYLLPLAGCGVSNHKNVYKAKVDSSHVQLATDDLTNKTIRRHLTTIDTLAFEIFSNQNWSRLHESHAQNIKVNWPDGHFTVGIDQHIADLKAMFVFAPNTSIKEHPIRFGSGNMTCVTGAMSGTFTEPMPRGNGKFSKPTGKFFIIPICMIGIWKDGVMVEEYLFWDNKAYLDQIGL